MSRIYQARQIRLTVNLPHDLSFRGETQDLQDMLGNLVDNACKWAVAHVMIEAWQEPNKTLRFVIDDDGPGMAPEKRAEAMKRGQRLDESLPGSGLGLAIVGDLAELYGGRFTLSTSPQGGLRSELYLPSA
ncbi:ATP-binding protein [Candidatus Raskinella chloraquaticus]